MVMFGAEHVRPVRALLESAPSLYLGKLSFTMYIYHNIAQYILFDYAPYSARVPEEVYAEHPNVHALGTLALTLCMSSVLYRVEIKCNALAKRFAAAMLAPRDEEVTASARESSVI